MEDEPRRFRDFPIKKQGELDSACGLYCIVSAAIWLRPDFQDDAGGAAGVVFGTPRRYATDLLVGEGLGPRRLARLAKRAGLQLRSSGTTTYEQLLEPFDVANSLWLVMLEQQFKDPRGQTKPVRISESHYVLILAANKEDVVVADPHPWHAPIRRMAKGEFMESWTRKAHWAAQLVAR